MQEPRERIELEERHESQEPEAFAVGAAFFRPLSIALAVVAVIVAMVLVPPLLNVSRYRRQIASSISASLGRPVHLDAVTLNVLPLPGFTLQNFVVAEDPEFGAEPVIRANSVRATLRLRSLWRRRVEFSRISLTEPSVNVVHLADGRWNLEGILLQASRMPVAPTAQQSAGAIQRFPYIEATGARVNLKEGGRKTPFSLVEAEFSLWLPQPGQWQVRLEGRPTRTDTAVSDTGIVRMEGTLGHAATLATVPIELHAEWTGVPLGSVSLIALARDAGLRGDLSLQASLQGLVGDNQATGQLQVTGLRRADFVPVRAAEVAIRCSAHATNTLVTLGDIRCAWPIAKQPAGTEHEQAGLMVSGSVGNIHRPETAEGQLEIANVSAAVLLDAWRVASPRVPTDVSLGGVMHGSIKRQDGETAGSVTIADASLRRGELEFIRDDLNLQLEDGTLRVEPVPVELGGERPASIAGQFTAAGSSLEFEGSGLRSRLLVLVGSLPQLSDGLEVLLPPGKTIFSLRAHAARVWGNPQVWTAGTTGPVRSSGRHATGPKRCGSPRSGRPCQVPGRSHR